MKRMLVINTKAYEEGTGRHAARLARICSRLSGSTDAEIIMSVQPSDIPSVSGMVKTFAQHIDDVEPGSHTGHILPEAVKTAGARGTLLNHSECRITNEEISTRIKRARETGLVVVCCVPDAKSVPAIASMGPDCIAIEPPELIGSGIPVSKAKPEVISDSVRLAREANPDVGVLCGAGISTAEDVARALELGASGVLLASSVVKSKDPEKAVRELLGGFG